MFVYTVQASQNQIAAIYTSRAAATIAAQHLKKVSPRQEFHVSRFDLEESVNMFYQGVNVYDTRSLK